MRNTGARSISLISLKSTWLKKKDDPKAKFDKDDYYKNCNKYRPIFHEKYLPYISVIFHNIYWEDKFPRLIESKQMKELVEKGKSRLIGISDVTCDLDGSIEFLKEYTNPN